MAKLRAYYRPQPHMVEIFKKKNQEELDFWENQTRKRSSPMKRMSLRLRSRWGALIVEYRRRLGEQMRLNNYLRKKASEVSERNKATLSKVRHTLREIIKNLTIENGRLKRRVIRVETSKKKELYKKSNYIKWLKTLNKKSNARNKMLREKQKVMDHNIRFFTMKVDIRVEAVTSILTAYEELRQKEILTFEELTFFAVGYELETFGKFDIEYKFGQGSAYYFTSLSKKLTKAGFIKKLNRKKVYFLTELGRNRFEEILKYIGRKNPKSQWNSEITLKYSSTANFRNGTIYDPFKQPLLNQSTAGSQGKLPANTRSRNKNSKGLGEQPAGT